MRCTIVYITFITESKKNVSAGGVHFHGRSSFPRAYLYLGNCSIGCCVLHESEDLLDNVQ